MTTQNKTHPVIERFQLDKNTVQILKSMTPEFGFNGLGELVFRRTYSRDNEDWADVVKRVVEGCMSIRKNHFVKNSLEWDDNIWQIFAKNMAVSLFKMEWLPPGRGLWMMGTEFTYNRGSMALYNCFKVDTKFWTSEGLKSFQDFQDGDKVIVRGNNKWVDATVKCFGEQELWKLTVQKGSVQDTIYTTEGHRWLAKTKKCDGRYSFKVKTTAELEANCKLHSFSKRTNFQCFEPCGIQHGIVFGDGTKSSNVDNCCITLCGDKAELSRYFFTPRKNNSTITGLPNTWKDLPPLSMNKEYLLGFMIGWFATDGYMDDNSRMSLSNSSIDILNFARDILFKLDITTGSVKMTRERSPYDKPSYVIHINREYIPEYFFIRDKHRQKRKVSTLFNWKVLDVEPTGQKEKVWCVVEPEFEEFTLENGILTKNCSAVDTTPDLVHAAEWSMDCLMNGVGVGFNTLWRGKTVAPDKNDTVTYVIPDSREGWVESLIKLMCAYIDSPKYGKNKFPVFDYSQIREKGLPIKGFGGTASGPEPLKDMHKRIEGYLDSLCKGRLQCKSKTYKEINPGDWKQVEIEIDKPYSHTRLVADVFNAIGACVVAGNVRRSAEIALGSVGDDDFINLKNFEINPERGDIAWMSNNSVVLKAGGDYSDFACIPEMAKRICDNGEPGMINLHNIQRYGRFGKEQPDKATLVNPCVTADTWIMTSLGSIQVKDLINRPFMAIVDGKEYNCFTGFFHTGNKTVYEISTVEGFKIKATEDHRFMTNNSEWVELKDLVEGDELKIHNHTERNVDINTLSTNFAEGWLIGSLYGDGTFYYNNDKPSTAYLCYWGENRGKMADVAISRMDLIGCRRKTESMCGTEYKDKLTIQNNHLFLIASQYISRGKILLDAIESKPLEFQAGFLRGWFDSDGCVTGTNGKGYSVRLASNQLDSLYRAQRMALRLGVYGKVHQNRRDEHDKLMPDGNGGMKMYHCQAQHEFIISRASMKVFYDKIGFDEEEKMKKLGEILSSYKRPLYGVRFIGTIKSIEKLGTQEVYDATVDTIHAFDGNGFYAHNCGEISLESFETCNLAEVFPPRCNSETEFYQALKYATFFSSTVSLLPTHRPETNAVIARNRRIGVSISGIAQWASGAVPDEWGPMNYTKMSEFLRAGYKVVKSTNIELAQQAGVPASVRVTTVKPSGSISLLAGATPGVHYPVSRYAIRRVRIGETSPLVQPLIDAGVPHEKDICSQNTLVFEFVIDHGNVRPCEEVSPWEQFSLVQMLQKHYADNCVSASIYFDREKDGPDVEKMLAMYIPLLKSVSMMPSNKGVYAQAPYEALTKEEYEKRLAGFTYPTYGNVQGNVPEGSKYCSGDTCEL